MTPICYCVLRILLRTASTTRGRTVPDSPKAFVERRSKGRGSTETPSKLFANHNALGQLANQSQHILFFGRRTFIKAGTNQAVCARMGREKHPVKFGAGQCQSDMGPSSPVVYDTGDKDSTANLYGPSVGKEFESGFISFRVFNADQAALAMCSGVKPAECNPQRYCIGGGGFFSDRQQCGDFTALDQASKHLTQSAVLLFYR